MDGIRILRPAALLAVLLCLVIMTASAVPPLPAEFYGKVTVNGADAASGTALIAKINDQIRGKLVISNPGQYGGNGIFDDKLVVAATEEDVKSADSTISFYIGDEKADQTVPFEPGTAKELDISVGGQSYDADFSATPTSGTAPLSVQFTDISTTQWSVWTWDFGDGSTSVIKNPTHVYESPGTYTVKMTVGSFGGYHTVTKNNYITVSSSGGIVADFSANPTSGAAPLTVEFTDLSTGSPTMWDWNFGDGTSEGMLANPVHIYQNPGTYTVTLTASSQTGGTSTKVKEGYITVSSSGGIVADFSATPTSGTAPLTVQFTDISTGSPTMWNWNFGDGTSEGMLANPVHIYQNPGTYTVTLTASSQTGGTSTKVKEGYITVSSSGTGPKAAFTVDKRTGPKPLTVQFTDQSTGNPTMWAWDFGDGTSEMLANPAHTYQEAGVYSISLTASNNAGSDTKTEPDYISVTGDIPPPVAMFEATPVSGSAPLQVKFSDISIGPPTSYLWDFGDGSTSTEAEPTHVYNAGGTYTVKLTVKNSGGSHTMTRENYISVSGGTGIVAEFVGTPTSGTAPLTVQFTDQSSGNPTMWAWDFGDGTSEMLANPSHTYQNAGTYTVKLTASSQTGGSSTKVKEGYITVSPSGGIIADFVGTPTNGNVPLSVQFSDRSQGGPTMWAWDFGDGGTAIVANPLHVYQQAGRFTVKLTASNQASSNTAIKTDYIETRSGPVGSGSIKIIYAPDRSSVYLDNVLKGETKFLKTFRIDNLAAGVYQLKVTKPGFTDYYLNIPVTSGRATEVVADMRLQPSQNGILSVYTYPSGSSVYVDGVLSGVGPLWLADVNPGVHQIRVTSDGYLDWNQQVEVRGGGSVTYVTAALYPSWWTPIYGYVMISSLPGNGVAYLDGVAQGQTPVTLSQVTPGQHTIRIEVPGYQPWEQIVTVLEGRTSYVLAQMTPGGSSGGDITPIIPASVASVASAGNTS